MYKESKGTFFGESESKTCQSCGAKAIGDVAYLYDDGWTEPETVCAEHHPWTIDLPNRVDDLAS